MIPIDEPGTEEELEPGRRRRLRLDLLIGAAALIAVALVARAIAGDKNDAGSAATSTPSRPSTAVAPTTAPASAPTAVLVTRADGQRRLLPALPARTGADPAACPPSVSCFTETAGPGTMLEAVVSRFPDAEVLAVRSVRLRDEPWGGALWFRELRFRVKGGELAVRVIARGPDARADGGRIGDHLYLRTTLQQYEVTVQVPAATGVTIEDLRRIAADDRLLIT